MSEGTEGAVQVKLEAELTLLDEGGGISAKITCDKDPRVIDLPWYPLQEELRKKYSESITRDMPIWFMKKAGHADRVCTAYGAVWHDKPVGKLFMLMRTLAKRTTFLMLPRGCSSPTSTRYEE